MVLLYSGRDPLLSFIIASKRTRVYEPKNMEIIDLEVHGGLYTLHSHINYSCTCSPNVSVWNLDQPTALSRITVVAKRDIAVSEEFVVTYVDPYLGVRERRSQLVAWGFGQCDCERCIEEREGKCCEDEGEGETEERSSDMDDLERELKEVLSFQHGWAVTNVGSLRLASRSGRTDHVASFSSCQTAARPRSFARSFCFP
jgi:hypothetical protein